MLPCTHRLNKRQPQESRMDLLGSAGSQNMVKALVLGTEAALLGKLIFFSRTRWDLNAAYEGPPGGCLGAGRSFQLPGGDFQESSAAWRNGSYWSGYPEAEMFPKEVLCVHSAVNQLSASRGPPAPRSARQAIDWHPLAGTLLSQPWTRKSS